MCTGSLLIAYELQPDSEDLALSLFSAYLRAGAHNKAQQLAMKMYRQFKDEQYMFWGITALVLQACLCAALSRAAGGQSARDRPVQEVGGRTS